MRLLITEVLPNNPIPPNSTRARERSRCQKVAANRRSASPTFSHLACADARSATTILRCRDRRRKTSPPPTPPPRRQHRASPSSTPARQGMNPVRRVAHERNAIRYVTMRARQRNRIAHPCATQGQISEPAAEANQNMTHKVRRIHRH